MRPANLILKECCLPLVQHKFYIMAKGKDARKNVKKEPLMTTKEKKAAKRDKKNKRT